MTVRVGATVTHIHDPTEAARWIDPLVSAAVGSSPFEARYQMTESACHATPSTRATSVMRDTKSRDKRIDVVEATPMSRMRQGLRTSNNWRSTLWVMVSMRLPVKPFAG